MFHFYKYSRLPRINKHANITCVTTIIMNETITMKLGQYHGQISDISD
jgi:hypothetical protein